MGRLSDAYSDEELADLTDEERAGLEDDNLNDNILMSGEELEPDTDEVEAAKGTEDNTEDEPEGEGGEEETPEADATADTEKQEGEAETPEADAAKPEAGEQGAEETPEPEPEAGTDKEDKAEPPAPAPNAYAEAQEKKKTLDGQIDELAEKVSNGEITELEYRQARRPLDEELHQAQRVIDREEDDRDTWFHSTVPDFIASHPEWEDADMNAAFSSAVMRIQDRELAAGHSQMTTDILAEADAELRKKFGMAAPASTPAKDPALASKQPGKRPDPPPSLARVPAAGIDTMQTVEQRLDGLSGEAFEAEFEKLTPEQQARYLP